MSDFTKAVGERVRYFRNKKGMTQEKLAECASVHLTFISQVELGKKNISLESLYNICQALDVSLQEFFQISETKYFSKMNSTMISIIDMLVDKSDEEQKAILKFITQLFEWKLPNK